MNWNIFDPFPAHALGRIAAPAVWQHHSNSQLSIELIAPIALGLAAAAVHDLYDVERPNLAPSPISLFIAIIAGSGEGKDAAAAPFVKPFFDFQEQADEAHAGKRKSHEIDLQEWAAGERKLLAELEDGVRENKDVSGIKNRLLAHGEKRPDLPKTPQAIYDDATVTAIKASLCERWRSGMLFSMEASSMFNGRLGTEYPFWNAAWGGQPIFLDRVAEGRRAVHDARVGMVVGIQEIPFRRFIKNRGDEAHDSGFTARYLISVPPSTKGLRVIGGWQMSTDALDAYAARVRELLDEAAAATSAGRKRTVLRFSPKAAEKFVGYYNHLQQLMAPGQPYSEISGQAAKAAENVARVAAVLHAFDELQGDISEDTLVRAAMIVQWFVNQFLTRFGGNDGKPTLEQDAAAVEQALWRAHASGLSSVLRQELKYWCPPGVQGTRLDRGLQYLIDSRRVIMLRYNGKMWVALTQGRPHVPVIDGVIPCAPKLK